MISEERQQPKRPAILEFLSGLFAGIGVILLTLLLALFSMGLFEKLLPIRGSAEMHFVAVAWALLAFGLGVFVFRKRAPQHRQSSFTAGLVTAAALFLLLDAPCWGRYFRMTRPGNKKFAALTR